MRILPVVLGAALLAAPALAEQREATAQVYCGSDNAKVNQDLIQLERTCLA
jgi:azurin